MEIARIEVGRTTGACTRRERIPAGIAGASVQVSFTDPVWDSLIKTVVFRGKETKIAEFDGAVAEIPHEVIPEPRIALYFGIFGHDPDTDLQIPLIEVYLGTTEKSTDANADPGADPTLPIWAQLQQEIEEIKQQGPGSGGNVDVYATVADMLNDADLATGRIVRTGGYYADGDGGHGEYLIVDEATVNPYDTLATANGKYAVLQHNGHVNAKQCGLKDKTYDGTAWIEYYNGTAKSIDINVNSMYIKKTVVLNNKTEIYSSIYPVTSLYWIGSTDSAVVSLFDGDGLHAAAYQSTKTVKIHDVSINANTAKVGFCLVNVTSSNIWNLYVYKGYIGFLMGNSWRNIFGLLHGSTQSYATFYQNEFVNKDIFDFSAISLNGSINASVYEMMISVHSPNGALLMGHGSENVFHMIEASEISDGGSGIGVYFGQHSGTVNTIYCENANPGAHYDLYADNLVSTDAGYDYNKGLMINQVRGRRFYLNNNITIGTLFVEDWIDTTHAQGVVFDGGAQAYRVAILNMPVGKYNESNMPMPYGLNGTMQALQKMQNKKNYRLIDTVTVETAGNFLRNTEPDGTPYNFDAVYMEIMLPASTAFPGCNMKFYTEGLVAVADPYLSSASAGDAARYMIIEVKNADGFVRETHSKLDQASNHQALYTTANKAAYKQPAKVVDIRSTQALQPGTVVTIYAY